ncbi:hypothetical protein Tco_0414790 [Tanacetum coccineum]
MILRELGIVDQAMHSLGRTYEMLGLVNLRHVRGNGPNWLFDIDALTISMNYKPVVAGNQTNGNACTKENIDVGQDGKKIVPDQEYILLPSGGGKDGIEHPENEDRRCQIQRTPRVNQEQDANVNSTNNINTVCPTVNVADIENNVVDENIVYGCIDDPNMPNFEEIVYSDDDEEVGAEADMNNLATTVPVSPIPTTRVYKDHPLEQIIRVPIPFVTYETVIKEWEDRMERAATTASSLEAGQDSGNINRTQSMATLNESFPQGIDSVNAAKHKLTDASTSLCCNPFTYCSKAISLMLPDITSTAGNLEGGVKFLMYLRFVQVFLDKLVEGMSKYKGIYVTPSHTKKIFANMKREEKKKSRRKQRKDSGLTKPIPDEATNKEPISTPSCDPPQSGEDRLQLTELMSLCTKLQKQVLDLEEAKIAQAKEIATSRVESSNDVSLGAQEDASKQVRKIANLDADAEVTLIDKTQERYDEEMLFDVQDDLQGEEVVTEKEVVEKEVSVVDLVTTAGEVVTTAVTTSATTITTAVQSTRPKIKGINHSRSEEQATQLQPIVSSSTTSLSKRTNGRQNAELEKERVAQKEASRTAIIKELDNIQAMIEADEQLAARLQAEEQE